MSILESQPRAAPGQTLPSLPEFDSLPQALHAFFDHYGYHPDAGLDQRISDLSAVSSDVQNGLVQIVAAHLLQAQVTSMGLRGPDPSGEMTVDTGLLLAMRDEVARAVLETKDLLVPTAYPGIEVCGLVSITLVEEDDEHTCDYHLQVDFGGDDVYRNNAGGGDLGAALLVDVGGDDMYRVDESHPGRAVAGSGMQGTGFLFSFGGSDSFDVILDDDGAINGGGNAGGVGLLVNFAKGNEYHGKTLGTSGPPSGGAINGAGFLGGSGTLLNIHGNNTMLGETGQSGAVNGAGSTIGGMGILVNGGGGNNHTGLVNGLRAAINGAAFGASSGILVNLGGENEHNGSTPYDGAINGAAWGPNLQGGVGVGVLLNHGGNNTHIAQAGGNGYLNGAAWESAVGLIASHGGDSLYEGSAQGRGLVNAAGGPAGVGVVMNRLGNNTFLGEATLNGFLNGAAWGNGLGLVVNGDGGNHFDGRVMRDGAINAAAFTGFGAIANHGPDNTHRGQIEGNGSINGAAVLAGVGVLWDRQGGSTFTGSVGGEGGVNGAVGGVLALDDVAGPLAAPGGLGLLVAGPGDNAYTSNGVSQGAGDHFGTGVLIDLGGNNTYEASGDAIAQAAGRHGGTGILIDLGLDATFSLLGGTEGQGAGLQGVGLLARLNDQGTSTYSAPAVGSIFGSDGGGIGLRIEHATAQGALPDLDCPSQEIHTVSLAPYVHHHVCEPDASTERAVIHPITGQPTGQTTDGGLSLILGAGILSAGGTVPLSCDPWSCTMASRTIMFSMV